MLSLLFCLLYAVLFYVHYMYNKLCWLGSEPSRGVSLKALDSIRNKITNVSAMTWMWIGCGLIVLSIALQAATLFLQSNQSLTFTLNLAGYIFAAFSVPFTIVQAYRSALEQQQLFEQERKVRDAADRQVFSETPKGRTLGALSQLRKEMRMDIQEPHS
jgi:hypothetical protein